MKLSSGVHRVATSTDHKVTGQVGQHAGAATWQSKVSLACCTPVQRKVKSFTSTCSSGYAIMAVTVRSLLAGTIHSSAQVHFGGILQMEKYLQLLQINPVQ